MDSNLLIMLIALGMSAYFSSCETAFLTFDKVKLFVWQKRRSLYTRAMGFFFPRQERFIITNLVGINLANVAFSSVAAVYLVGMGLPAWLVVIILTAVVLIFAEILPKTVTLPLADYLVRPYAVFLLIFYFLLYPIAALLSAVFKVFLLGHEELTHKLLSREALKRVVESHSKGLHPERVELVTSALSIAGQKMREVMTPRTDIIAASIDSPLEEIRQLVIASGHSKIIIYRNTIDDVAGYIHALDLLSGRVNSLSEMLRPAIFVSEFTPVIRGFKLLRRQRAGMLCVMDEYGGLDGIATVEDLTEELVGEIYDEYDRPQFRYRKLEEGRYLISGRTEIDELNRELNLKIEKLEGVETFGGWVVTKIGKIPLEKEQFEIDEFKIQVLLSDGVRVKMLLVEQL